MQLTHMFEDPQGESESHTCIWRVLIRKMNQIRERPMFGLGLPQLHRHGFLLVQQTTADLNENERTPSLIKRILT